MSYTSDLQKALQSRVVEYKSAVEAMQKNTVIDGDNVDIPVAEYAAAQNLQKEINEIKGILSAEAFGQEAERFANNPVSPAMSYGNDPGAGMQRKSLGEAFIQSAEFKAMKDGRHGKMDAPWKVTGGDLSGWGQKDVFTGMDQSGYGNNYSTSVGTVIQQDPMVPRAQLTQRVRDLFPVANTSANMITYIRSKGFTTGVGNRGNAAAVPTYVAADSSANPPVVAGFGVKPRSSLSFSTEKAPVETIAHWEVVHRNIIDDMPQLRATIDNELMYGLRLAEDDQILNGDGQNSNLLGLLNTPGIQTYTKVTADSYADALRRAATKCILAYYPANAYVLHPNDWETTELTKATGDGQYVLVSNVSIGAQRQVWRLPVVETPAITEGTFLTGAFGLGAQLYDRQEANIRISESHANIFVQNAIAILAEERLALAVKRPEAFVKGTFA